MNFFDNKLISFLVAPFVAAVALMFIDSIVSFKPELLPVENDLFRFSHKSIDFVVKEEPITVKGFLNSPIGVNAKKEARNILLDSSGSPEETTAEKKTIVKKVSFIFINKSEKKAIINGFIVGEGDTVADSMVLKIEEDRILIREANIGKRWLELQ